jgi:hypothetical protein
MTYCRHYKCRKCRFLAISVTSVANIIQSSCLCRVSNDITRTLKTPSKTGLRRRNHLMKSTKILPWKKPLKSQFLKANAPLPTIRECHAPYPSLGERSSTLCTLLGERWDFLRKFWAALPYPLSGSANAPYPSLGERCNTLCPILRERWAV